MTELTITPNYEKKRLKLSGTVAAGEHVAVTVAGGWAWASATGAALRLRLVFADKLIAEFPRRDAEPAETWTRGTDTADAACELNTNSAPAMKYLKFGGPCLWVLDDPELGTLYGTGEADILSWHKEPGEVPYDLDGYPDFVAEMKSAWMAYRNAVNAAIASKADQATTYTKTEVDEKIAAATNVRFKIVQELPPVAEAEESVIYLLPRTTSETGNSYDEYIVVSGAWERMGSTDIDLSGYVQSTRKVNGKPLSSDVTIGASDIADLGNSATKNVGTTSGTVAAGDDSRFSDARQPTAHSHAQSDVTGLAAALLAKTARTELFPPWAANTEYTTYSLVIHENAIYKCQTAHTSGAEWDSTKWGLASGADVLGVLLNYLALSNKPQINGHTLTGNQTGADLGLLDLSGGTMTGSIIGIRTNNDANREVSLAKINLAAAGIVRKGAGKLGICIGLTDGTEREASLYMDDDGKVYINTPNGFVEIPDATNGGTLALLSNLPYAIHAATVSSGTTPTVTAILARATNTATLGSSVTAATVTLPAATTGKMRDFFIALTVQGSTAPSLTWIDPATNTDADIAVGEDSLADIDTGLNVIMFSEAAGQNRWIVSVKHEEAAS